ncbi:proline-specific peptidase [Crepidotus variabilis]|uniref:Proline-specific peptidase n=1 Tax=Crepidotus variabilis TaxID=179855 RepID=A0A9P6JKX5_9AGAR|nr:proline-specific peptidase [Crepidotus variabilis]
MHNLRFLGVILAFCTPSFAFSSSGSAGCIPTPSKVSVCEGDVPFSYQGSEYKTHYQLFGDLESRFTPLVVLHGGPGLSYDYLLPFANLTEDYGIPVILYDQIGNGRSSHVPTAPVEFWTIKLFMDELSNLINYFNIQNDFSLAGHSWGTILGSEFVVQRQPKGLQHLILSDGLASNELWEESVGQLLSEFPDDVQHGFEVGLDDPPAFESAMAKFYAVHGIRLKTLPAAYLATIDWLFGPKADQTVAKLSGVITANWTIIDRIPQIKTKTLVINGKYDQSQDFVIGPFVEKLPNNEWVKFNNSSHMPFWEEPAAYLSKVGDFLTEDSISISGSVHVKIDTIV